MDKHWVAQAVEWLQTSRQPVPHEINELDWKAQLSDNKERLTEHLIAFANHPNGGNLAFGVAEPNASLVGITPEQVAEIVGRLTNLGRDAIEPPLVLDHALVEVEGTPLLFIYIPECRNKPVHRRGKSIKIH